MTTAVYSLKDRAMLIDSKITFGGVYPRVTDNKMEVHILINGDGKEEEFLVASSGCQISGNLAILHLKGKTSARPVFDAGDEFNILAMNKDAELYVVDKRLELIPYKTEMYAIGSGSAIVHSLYLAGYTILDATKKAIEIDANSCPPLLKGYFNGSEFIIEGVK